MHGVRYRLLSPMFSLCMLGQEHDGLIEWCTGEVCVMRQELDGLIEWCTGEVCV